MTRTVRNGELVTTTVRGIQRRRVLIWETGKGTSTKYFIRRLAEDGSGPYRAIEYEFPWPNYKTAGTGEHLAMALRNAKLWINDGTLCTRHTTNHTAASAIVGAPCNEVWESDWVLTDTGGERFTGDDLAVIMKAKGWWRK